MDQKVKILAVMARNRQAWYRNSDFQKQNLGELFVGYEAGPRIAELDKKFPFLFERRDDGKFAERRLRHLNIGELMQLPREYQEILMRSQDAPSVAAEPKPETESVKVASATQPGKQYTVTIVDGQPQCNCPGFKFRHKCSHISVINPHEHGKV